MRPTGNDVMPGIRLDAVTTDCPDSKAKVTSCHPLTGMGTVEVEDGFYPILAGTTLDLVFQQIDTCQSPTWPTQERGPQMYLDTAVDEIENAVKLAGSLGARQASDQPGERWGVMLDPAGNPFCLSHHR
jgi:hypothetical protein